MDYKESHFEDAVVEVFEGLGYEYGYGPDIARDTRNPLYMDTVCAQLAELNPDYPDEVIGEALRQLQHIEHGSLLQKNERFTDWLQNGLEITYQDGGESRTVLVKLIDYDEPDNNAFQVINQWTVEGNSNKRPDVIVFVNGLPLVVIELKSCMADDVDLENGYRQLKNYMQEIPALFEYNAFLVTSDLRASKVGTITASYDRFQEWKTVDGSYEATGFAQWSTLFEGMFAPERFLDILKNFILFSEDADPAKSKKVLAAYHQYFAVKKALQSAEEASKTDGRGGVFWHTQGSGKSLSMVFFAKQLQNVLESPTIVVITDRNDLDGQLYGQFCDCKAFLRQDPKQATSRANLLELLKGHQANGIFFTTMQKFEETDEPLSGRHNIVVLADEAHRGHYGLTEKVDKAGNIHIGAALLIREALPHATFIGFTGTPLSNKDRNTYEVFGNCIDAYDMTQAVEDGATRPVYYEARVINLGLDEKVLGEIDKEYEQLSEHAETYDIERSKHELSRMDSVLGAPQTIDTLCHDIIAHYEGREHELTGKALIVAYSRPIAMDVYKQILELRPGWAGKVKVVMTSNNNDPEEWRNIIGNDSHKAELAREFKDDDGPVKIAIVVDMWLTGFDVPSLATMYLYKPMAGHNLMQAIARVNRVFTDKKTGAFKEGGLVVDYIGIASALKAAMNDYTVRDQKNYGNMDIRDTAYKKFRDQLAICGDLFHGYDFGDFLHGETSAKRRADLIGGGIDFAFSFDEKKREAFLIESLALKQAGSLCQSLQTKEERMQAAFFEAVRISVRSVAAPGKMSYREINRAVASLLEQSIKSEGVINLFEDVNEEFSLFDPSFLEEIARMKHKNLAAELLQKLLNEQIRLYQRTNIVQAEKFSERMQRVMNAYRNGQLTNAEVIDELRKMAEDIAKAHEEGGKLGFSPEELAFYDALTRQEAVKDCYSNDELKAMVQELTETLRKSRTIDWDKKSAVRARMRMDIKRLLKKYHYPPEEQESAMDTVLAQCEKWAETEN